MHFLFSLHLGWQLSESADHTLWAPTKIVGQLGHLEPTFCFGVRW
jgi:hypothetical protein